MENQKNLQIKYLFHDNTLNKNSFLAKKRKKALSQLPQKLEILEIQSKISKKAKQKFELKAKWEEFIRVQLKTHKSYHKTREKSAILIQKHVRGFLTRLKTDVSLLEIEEKLWKNSLQSLNNQVNKIRLGLEIILTPAVLLIQNAYKRYCKRKNIHSWLKSYNYFKQIKINESEILIRKWLKTASNKSKIMTLVFENYKAAKLLQIRRNLSIIKLKKVWTKRKLSFMSFKYNIQRFKRKASMLQSKEMYKQYLEALSLNKFEKKDLDSGSKSSDNSRSSIDADYQETKKLKLMIQQKIQEKILKGKISYSVKSFKNKLILPIMAEKIPFYSKRSTKLYENTDSSQLKTKFIDRMVKKIPVRETAIFSAVKVNRKNYVIKKQDFSPNLMFYESKPQEGYIKTKQKSLDMINYSKKPDHGFHKRMSQRSSVWSRKKFTSERVHSSLDVY